MEPETAEILQYLDPEQFLLMILLYLMIHHYHDPPVPDDLPMPDDPPVS